MTSHAVQQQTRAVPRRHLVQPAPRNQKHLRDHISGVLRIAGAPHGIRQQGATVVPVEPLETILSTLASHGPRTTAGDACQVFRGSAAVAMTRRPGMRRKSATFPVATASPWATAVAPIQRS
jgi:hypothetical protein